MPLSHKTNKENLLNDEFGAYLQQLANQLGYANAAEALGLHRGSYNTMKRLYADYNVDAPTRTNQHSSASSPNAPSDTLATKVRWVPLNRAERRQSGLERTVVISDIHVPFQDSGAIEVAFSIIRDLVPDTIIIAGDLMDFFSISKYVKDPNRKLYLQKEIDAGIEFLKELREVAGDARIIFVQGNHEMRLEDYIKEKAPSLFNLDKLTFESLLELDSLDIEYIRGKSQTKTAYYRYGDIRIGHFDAIAPTAGGTAHRLMNKYRSPVVQGHCHRLALVSYTDAEGETMYGAESGCLCMTSDDNVDYVEVPNWQHGMVVITRFLDTDEDLIEIVPIINGKAKFHDIIHEAA